MYPVGKNGWKSIRETAELPNLFFPFRVLMHQGMFFEQSFYCINKRCMKSYVREYLERSSMKRSRSRLDHKRSLTNESHEHATRHMFFWVILNVYIDSECYVTLWRHQRLLVTEFTSKPGWKSWKFQINVFA